jgi:hypothetical protein
MNNMNLTVVPRSELPPDVRATVTEMVESNRDDIMRLSHAFSQAAAGHGAAHDATVHRSDDE